MQTICLVMLVAILLSKIIPKYSFPTEGDSIGEISRQKRFIFEDILRDTNKKLFDPLLVNGGSVSSGGRMKFRLGRRSVQDVLITQGHHELQEHFEDDALKSVEGDEHAVEHKRKAKRQIETEKEAEDPMLRSFIPPGGTFDHNVQTNTYGGRLRIFGIPIGLSLSKRKHSGDEPDEGTNLSQHLVNEEQSAKSLAGGLIGNLFGAEVYKLVDKYRNAGIAALG